MFAFALSLPPLAPSLALLALAIFVLGACNGVVAAGMNAHASLIERRKGSPIMSSFHAAFSLGGLAGAGAGGALLARGLGPQTCLALIGAGILAIVLASAAWLRLPLHEQVQPGPAFARPSRALLGIAGLAFLCMMTEGAMADWSAVYLADSLHASAVLAAAGYGAFSLTMAAGRLLGDRAVRVLSDGWIVRAGALLAATGFGLAVWAPHPAMVILGFALVGIGLANIVPVLFSAAGRTWTQAPSVGVAMTVTAGFTGFLTGPPVIGLTAQLVGLRAAMVLLIASALVVAGLARAGGSASIKGSGEQANGKPM
jgi:predicted MFS family arabinose efflux permease